MNITRRHFMTGAAAAALASSHSSFAQSQPSPKAAEVIPGTDTVLKFHKDGSVRPFAGNTVICHLPAQCGMRDVMSDLREQLKTSPFRNRLGLTTVDSYHMTIFAGANDQGRKASGWPVYVSQGATIEHCNAAVMERMQTLRLQYELPFRVMIDVPATLSYPRACTLRMKAVNDQEEKNLRSVRDQLAEAYGFRLPGHATYAFHVTMSYQMTPFTDSERKEYQDLLAAYVQKMVAEQPVLELGNPEYCTFADMLRFTPSLLLACH